MSFLDKVKRGWRLGQVVATVIGAGQAPPPAKLPDHLASQYRQYSTQVRPEQVRREIRRLTTKTNEPTTSLTARDAKRLRGK